MEARQSPPAPAAGPRGRSRATPWHRLLDAVWNLNVTRDVPSTYEMLGRQAIGLVNADGAAIYAPQESGGVRCAWSEGVSATYTESVTRAVAQIPGGEVLREAKARVITDAPVQKRWVRLAELTRQEGIRTIGLFPMVMEGRVCAVLAVYHRRVRPYRRWEKEALTAFAYQAALALTGAELHEEARRRTEELQQMYDRLQDAYRQLQAFQEIGTELAASLDVQHVLGTVARYAAELTGSDAGGVFEYHPEEGSLTVSASYDAPESLVEGIRRARVQLGQGAIGRAAAERRPVQVQDTETDPDYPFRYLTRPRGIRAILAVPMLSGDELVGGVVVWRRTPGPFGQGEVQLLETLAQQSTAAIRNARLYSALEQAYDNTLEALTAALDVRDRDTEGHSRRVAALALAIAREMQLSPREQQALYRGGLLHDIGKIGIPDSILHKPGPLSDEEWAVMRNHPNLGFQVLNRVEFLQPVTAVVLYHHERFDGLGYPMGLRGEQIPLVARVFAVADAYDAMTSWRPYRPALDSATAVREIVRHSGTQFDPEVVNAFLRVMARGDRAIHHDCRNVNRN